MARRFLAHGAGDATSAGISSTCCAASLPGPPAWSNTSRTVSLVAFSSYSPGFVTEPATATCRLRYFVTTKLNCGLTKYLSRRCRISVCTSCSVSPPTCSLPIVGSTAVPFPPTLKSQRLSSSISGTEISNISPGAEWIIRPRALCAPQLPQARQAILIQIFGIVASTSDGSALESLRGIRCSGGRASGQSQSDRYNAGYNHNTSHGYTSQKYSSYPSLCTDYFWHYSSHYSRARVSVSDKRVQSPLGDHWIIMRSQPWR